MTPIKVEKTEIFKDANGDHIVCRGKLVLIQLPNTLQISKGDLVYSEATEAYQIQSYDVTKGSPLINSALKPVTPIIISETEEIKVGDKVWDKDNFLIGTVTAEAAPHVKVKYDGSDEVMGYTGEFFKILALPDHFSPEHIQFIIEGKLNNQDYVIVECEGSVQGFSESPLPMYICKIKVTDGHIKLFPIKWKNQMFLDEKYSGPPDNSKYILQEVIQTHQEKVSMYSKLPKEELIEMLIECNRILSSRTLDTQMTDGNQFGYGDSRVNSNADDWRDNAAVGATEKFLNTPTPGENQCHVNRT